MPFHDLMIIKFYQVCPQVSICYRFVWIRYEINNTANLKMQKFLGLHIFPYHSNIVTTIAFTHIFIYIRNRKRIFFWLKLYLHEKNNKFNKINYFSKNHTTRLIIKLDIEGRKEIMLMGCF